MEFTVTVASSSSSSTAEREDLEGRSWSDIHLEEEKKAATKQQEEEEKKVEVKEEEEKKETVEEKEKEKTESSSSTESEEFDLALTPFSMMWTFGRNIKVPFVNLTTASQSVIFYSAAHCGILYDYEFAKKMKILQGHPSWIMSLSCDKYGKYMVSADAEEAVIVWEIERRVPLCSIFRPYKKKCGSSIVAMHPNGTFFICVSNTKVQHVALWEWTLGQDKPNGRFSEYFPYWYAQGLFLGTCKIKTEYGKVVHIGFCPKRDKHFVVTTVTHALFGLWTLQGRNKAPCEIHLYIPIKTAQDVGDFSMSTYLMSSHFTLTATKEGNVVVWSDVEYEQSYDLSIPIKNEKTLLKVQRLDKKSINVITTFKDIVVTGNQTGEVKFYDKTLRLLYWVQSFKLESISAIDFHLSYGLVENELESEVDQITAVLNPFDALIKIFKRIIGEEKRKLAQIEAEEKKKTPKFISALVNAKLKEGLINATADKSKFVQDIINVTLEEVAEYYADALANAQNFIKDIIDSTLEDVFEMPPEVTVPPAVGEILETITGPEALLGSPKQIVLDILDEIIDSLEELAFPDPPDPESMAAEVMRDILYRAAHKGHSAKEMSFLKHIPEDILERVLPKEEGPVPPVVEEVMEEAIEALVTNVEESYEEMKVFTQELVDTAVKKAEEEKPVVMYNAEELANNIIRQLLGKLESLSHAVEEMEFPAYTFLNLYKFLTRPRVGTKQLAAPSDASLERKPFLVGDFVVSTMKGEIGTVNFLKNTYTVIVENCEYLVTAIDCHPFKQHLIVGNSGGNVILYSFLMHRKKIVETNVIYKMGDEEDVSVSALKFAPSGHFLTCGLSNGVLWILDPVLLTPLKEIPFRNVDSTITKICFSDDSHWFSHMDDGNRVCLYHCKDAHGLLVTYMGKHRPHYRRLQDICFMRSSENELVLYSVGEDHLLVQYDLYRSEPDRIEIGMMERIAQTAYPVCLIPYPKFSSETFILIADSEYKFKLINEVTKMCRKTCLGPRFDRPVRKFIMLGSKDGTPTKYMIFASDKAIGIQILPIDGNPYKCVGTIGHPEMITHITALDDTKVLFTTGVNDNCVLMWKINIRAANVMQRLGGEGLDPYFCLIEGGESGWLFKKIQDFFYYALIFHQGENTSDERLVSSHLPLCELPDYMRALGYFPSEYEIENMMHEISYATFAETGLLEKAISFDDLVKLYLNHQPVSGISIAKLREAFNEFTLHYEDDQPVMDRDTFVEIMQERGECFSEDQVITYLKFLIGPEGKKRHGRKHKDKAKEPVKENSDISRDDYDDPFSFLPEEITFDYFINELLGVKTKTKKRRKLKRKEKEKKAEKRVDEETEEDTDEEADGELPKYIDEDEDNENEDNENEDNENEDNENETENET